MQGKLGFKYPQDLWIIFLLIVLYNFDWRFLSGISAYTNLSKFSDVFDLSLGDNIIKIWVCDNPFFWNSITWIYAITFSNTSFTKRSLVIDFNFNLKILDIKSKRSLACWFDKSLLVISG